MSAGSGTGQGAGQRRSRQGGLAFTLGRIPVSMPWSGLLGIGLIAYLWSDRFEIDPAQPTQTAVLALVFAVLFYLSILGHELAHAWVAGAAGFPVHGITLWVLGGFTSYERRTASPLREGLIAVSGPLSSVAIGFAAAIAASAAYSGDPRVYVIAYALAVSNIVLGIYNALPGLPLDGGAVLKCVVWAISGNEHRGTIIAAWAGRLMAVLVFVAPFYLALRSGYQPDVSNIVISGLVAAYLYAGASDALRRARQGERIPQLSARALSRPAVLVAHDTPLAEAIRQRDLHSATGMVIVDPDGRPTALAQDDAVTAVPLQRRPWVPVSSVSGLLDPRAVVSAELVGESLLDAMGAFPADGYLVRDAAGDLVGILHTKDVERALSGPR
ncbi:unannotated protein [freshwater metagenome]|uniref:Unannotated protein n=1 Tax=freshwater metagenome TaxID=449393 RepID=A0A6J7KJ92_9ZZZZ|nr:site-2 protease family protein [Actinomycetota bacterium]MSW37478.1 site-2 protease family protein [Actinomycetota bacterium]MSX38877.1 site-2 protease family protein [Actinomycetota bacterium]